MRVSIDLIDTRYEVETGFFEYLVSDGHSSWEYAKDDSFDVQIFCTGTCRVIMQ